MERLTKRINGTVLIADDIDGRYTANEVIDILAERLAEYEDTMGTPQDIRNLQEKYGIILDLNAKQAEALDYARTIQAEGVRLKVELEMVKAELDAALADLNEVRPCTLCAYRRTTKMCRTCMGEAWKWRGVKGNNVPGKSATDTAELDSMAAYLKKLGCEACKHRYCDVYAEPCESCMEGENFPAWEWRGDRE